MHEVEETTSGVGVPLLHTTMIGARGGKGRPLVSPIRRGLVDGHLVLIPRVGLPKRGHLVPAFLAEHQLSDCVIAMRFERQRVAKEVCRLITHRFDEFRALWGGTGAQYTTIEKVVWFLRRIGVECRSR